MAAEVKERSQVTQLGELPINTVIKSVKQGLYIKEADHSWAEIFAHCIDCVTEIDDTWGVKGATGQTALQFFGRYKVISRPVRVVKLRVQGKWVEVTTEDALAFLATKYGGWVK